MSVLLLDEQLPKPHHIPVRGASLADVEHVRSQLDTLHKMYLAGVRCLVRNLSENLPSPIDMRGFEACADDAIQELDGKLAALDKGGMR